jgi:hypothetical protein
MTNPFGWVTMEDMTNHFDGEKFDLKFKRGKEYRKYLQTFAEILKFIQTHIDFKVSSRGWAYLLETNNLITKGEFEKVQNLVNKARKEGFLPLDFVAEDDARKFDNVIEPETDTIPQRLHDFIDWTLNHIWQNHTADYWEGEDYYIQLLVEKIDLVTLFEPVVQKYKIPIANSKGWSSILQRYEMIKRFEEAEDRGQTPVLLYCGDLDPFGMAISDYLEKNIQDLEKGTLWNPYNLIIDRFGLNKDFVDQHNITWIDNLKTGTGKDADENNPIVAEYVRINGYRKVEANALVTRAAEGRKLLEDTIQKYLGVDATERFTVKERSIRDEYKKLIADTGLKTPLQKALDSLKSYL